MLNNEIIVGGIPVLVHSDLHAAVNSVFSFNGDHVIPGLAIAINPEKIMKARSDSKLMETLQSASFRFADGIGVVLALRKKGARQAARIPGCEFWIALMQKAGQLQQPVFLVGAKPVVLNQVQEKLVRDFGANVVGIQDGYFSEAEEDELIQRIKASGARIVTVAMGSPRQELFMSRCRQTYPEAFYMGVGGTYDVFSGNVKRAPPWTCKLNMEWLYRLVSNPKRFGRQVVLLEYLRLLMLKKI